MTRSSAFCHALIVRKFLAILVASRGSRVWGRLNRWQLNPYRGSFPHCTVNGHSTMVLSDNAVHHGEAKAGAGWLRGVEGIENVRQILLGNARAAIGDRDAEMAVVLGRADGDLSA